MTRTQRIPRDASPDDPWRPEDWYDHPGWYDILHTPDTAWEVDGLERIARRFLGRARPRRARETWLEPACGTGRYLRLAAARGRRVIGLDLNPRMIEYARRVFARRGLSGELRVGDMSRFRLSPGRRADLAFCLINSSRHLRTDRAMLGHLRCVWAALRPGGVYALGLSLTHYGAEFPTEEVFRGVRGGCAVTQLAEFLVPAGRFERVINHLTITTPGGERHLDNSFDLRCYSGKQLARLIDASEFEVVGVVDEEGRDAVTPTLSTWRRADVSGYGVFVLRRPG